MKTTRARHTIEFTQEQCSGSKMARSKPPWRVRRKWPCKRCSTGSRRASSARSKMRITVGKSQANGDCPIACLADLGGPRSREKSPPSRFQLSTAVLRVTTLRDYGQRFPGVVDDCRLACVMVVLGNRIHRIVGVGPHLVHALDGTVAYGTAVVPRDVGTDWNRFERRLLAGSHGVAPAGAV